MGVRELIQRIFEPEIDKNELPGEWRRICPSAFMGCESAKLDREYFEKECSDAGESSCFIIRVSIENERARYSGVI